ncbi:hypothetical protein JL475_01495 [Streptomyces sp. M2CJ-2]|nr:hypothetical protein [Streptomyces sp. M2CJ-2]
MVPKNAAIPGRFSPLARDAAKSSPLAHFDVQPLAVREPVQAAPRKPSRCASKSATP